MGEAPDPRVVASRRRIAAAAQRLFLTHGYVATTIADIAEAAGVALQTVYNAVGSKAAVLNLVLDTAAAGSQAPGSVPEFMARRVSAAGGAGEAVDVLAEWFAEVHPRTADVFRVIREAAAVDPEIAELRDRRDRARLDNYHLAARAILERSGATGGDDGVEKASLAAAIWSLGHPETYAMLVIDRGWSLERYHRWIARQLHLVIQA